MVKFSIIKIIASICFILSLIDCSYISSYGIESIDRLKRENSIVVVKQLNPVEIYENIAIGENIIDLKTVLEENNDNKEQDAVEETSEPAANSNTKDSFQNFQFIDFIF